MIKVHSLHTSLAINMEAIEPKDVDVFNNEPHTHDFWEIGFFEKGDGLHTIDFEEYPIKTGTLYFLKKGIVHTMFRKKGSHGKVILFSDEVFEQKKLLHQLLYSLPHVYLSNEKILFVKQLFFQMESFLHEKVSSNILTQYLQLILSFFETHATKSLVVDEKIHAFLQYVEMNYSAKLTVDECASNLNISYQKLHAEIQLKLNKSPLDILRERVILQAKRLLFNTHQSVKEIAYSLEFEDTSYFSKYFKSQTGYAPLAFREMSRKNEYKNSIA